MPSLKRRRATINYPGEFAPLVRERMRQEHYRTESAYFNGLLFFDLIARCPHKLTSRIMAEPQEVQDQLIAEIVRDFTNGKPLNSRWLYYRLKEISAEHSALAEQPAEQQP